MNTTAKTNMKTTTILGLILAAGATAHAQQPHSSMQTVPIEGGTPMLSSPDGATGTIKVTGGTCTACPAPTQASSTGIPERAGSISARAAVAGSGNGTLTITGAAGPNGEIHYSVAPEDAGKLGVPLTLSLAGSGDLQLGTDGEPAAYLGVATSPVPRELYAQLPIPRNTGLLLDAVAENSPAAKAGLQEGDVCAKLDDQILIQPVQLNVLVTGHKEGDTVKLSYVRKGQITETTAVLAKREKANHAAAGEVEVHQSSGTLTLSGAQPLRTFVGRVEGGKESAKDGGWPQSAVFSAAAAASPPSSTDNAELRKELQQLRATLDAMQERLK